MTSICDNIALTIGGSAHASAQSIVARVRERDAAGEVRSTVVIALGGLQCMRALALAPECLVALQACSTLRGFEVLPLVDCSHKQRAHHRCTRQHPCSAHAEAYALLCISVLDTFMQ